MFISLKFHQKLRNHFLSEASHATRLKAEVTSSTQNLNRKQWKSLKSLEESIPRSQVVRIIDGDDELKKTTMSPIIAAIASRLLTSRSSLDLKFND